MIITIIPRMHEIHHDTIKYFSLCSFYAIQWLVDIVCGKILSGENTGEWAVCIATTEYKKGSNW